MALFLDQTLKFGDLTYKIWKGSMPKIMGHLLVFLCTGGMEPSNIATVTCVMVIVIIVFVICTLERTPVENFSAL